MNRDTGIRNLMPGVRFDDEIKEDLRSQLAIKKRLEGMTTPNPVQSPDVRFTPSIDLKPTEIVHKEGEYGHPGYWKNEKEYEKHLISSPSKKQHNKAFNMGNAILKVSFSAPRSCARINPTCRESIGIAPSEKRVSASAVSSARQCPLAIRIIISIPDFCIWTSKFTI